MPQQNKKNTKKVLVCSAWPYASGIPHLGNIQTSLLSGGVFTRYYRLRGFDVVHVSGSDAHGTRIEFEAEKKGLTPGELARQTHKIIISILDKFNIDIDNYTITTNPTHKKFVQDIHRKMDANGYISTKEEERAYCNNCEKFLADRFIEGTCPDCGSEEAHGNQCDECGTLLEPEELLNPLCAICNSDKIDFRRTKHWYLDLQKLRPQLEEYVQKRFTNWPDNVTRFTQNMLNSGMEPKAITRDIKWGIPAPFKGAESKVIYVWAEAALGYVSATMEHFQNQGEKEKWKEFWFSDQSRHIYTHAKDNIPFHTLLFPGQLIASGEPYHLPDQISASEYLNWIGGKSFSKSRGVGLYADDALELLHPTFWRFYLLYFRPEKKDINFSWRELNKAVNNVFVDNVSNFVHRVTSFAYSNFGSNVPPGKISPRILDKTTKTKEDVEKIMESGFLSGALRKICRLANFGNRYFQQEKPWENNNVTVVRSGLQLAQSIAIMLEPFVPDFSSDVYSILNLKNPRWSNILSDKWSATINEPHALLDKPDIKELKERYEKKNQDKTSTISIDKGRSKLNEEIISIDDFAKLDLRVGKIERVEEIPGADELYKIKINVGENSLTTVSGIKKDYSADELKSKTVIVLTNLEPTEIYGEKSECMILAATDGDLALLTTDKNISPGTQVE